MTESKPVALVTGGSMGLGRAVADHLSLTHEVITCARSGEVSFYCDASSYHDVVAMVDRIVGDYGQIDVLVCNAAIYGPVAPLDETNWKDWARAFEIDTLGTIIPCKLVLPVMRRQGHGKIITLSGGGVRPQPNCTAYNASKGAVLRFTEALGADLVGTGIDVNAVAPGVLDTRMRLRSPKPEDPEANMQKAVDLIAWLASSASDGTTGRVFSAVWDDWEHLGELGKDDYKMRRVVPE